MELYQRIKYIVEGQFKASVNEKERIDAITHLMTLEIQVITTNFAKYIEADPGNYSDRLNEFMDTEFIKVLKREI